MRRVGLFIGITVIALLLLILALQVLRNTSVSQSPIGQVTPTITEENQLFVYFVAVGDNGAKGEKIGCDDSLIPVKQDIEPGENTVDRALSILLSFKETNIAESGLYNALAGSTLTLDKVETSGDLTSIYLTGQLTLGGVCDSPRVQEQLKATVLQFPEIQQVNFYLNNTLLEDVLSQRG